LRTLLAELLEFQQFAHDDSGESGDPKLDSDLRLASAQWCRARYWVTSNLASMESAAASMSASGSCDLLSKPTPSAVHDEARPNNPVAACK